MQKLGILGVLASAALAGPTLALSQSVGGNDGIVLVVGTPWSDLDRIIADAGGRPVGLLRAPLATMAVAEGQPDEFRDRLSGSGAWLTLDAGTLAMICGVSA